MKLRRTSGAVAAVLLGTAPLVAAAPVANAQTAGTVFLQTVPALAGVSLSVGAAVVTTGGDGSASIQVADLNGVAHSVFLAGGYLGGGTSVTVRKVVSAPHSAPHQSHLTVGLDVTSTVQIHIDSGKTGIPVNTIRSVRLHSATGDDLVVDPQRTTTVSLLSRRASLVGGQMSARAVTWSVDRIIAGPGVALTTATPRFDPFGQSTWQLQLQPVHGVVQIQTVPATPNVTFLLDGASITTGPNGAAQAPVDDLNSVASGLRLSSHDAGPLSVSLLYVNRLKPTAQHQRRLLAALTVRRPVSLRFVDHDGHSVDSARISQVVLDGGDGQLRLGSTDLADPVMLLASTATQVDKVWHSRPSTYSVASVRLDGGDAVFAGRQRIAPSTADNWTVTLSVFSVTVKVHDALFGSRVSSRVLIARPDGSTYPVHIGSGQPTVVRSMVRGLYDVKVDAAVFGAHTKVLVSRDDSVDLRVVTLLDAVVIAFSSLAFVAAIVFGGVWYARRRNRATAGEAR